MVEIHFFDETIKCPKPESLSDLINYIKDEFMFSEDHINGLSLQYYDDKGNVETLSYQNYDQFLENKNLVVDIVCGEKSKLFQDAFHSFEKNEKQEEPKNKKYNEISQISINSIQNKLESIQNCYEEEQKLEQNLENEQTLPGLIKEKLNKCKDDLIKTLKGEILKNSEMIYYNNVQSSKVVNTNNSSLSTIEHIGVSCNICGVCPIKGIRFKCLLCPSMDFCENCESTLGEEHGHPLAVLKYPIV